MPATGDRPAEVSRDRPKQVTLLVSCLLLVLPAYGQQPESYQALPNQDRQAYKIAVDVALVVLPVSVIDNKGAAVGGLAAGDFRVYEDGRPQKIVLFEHEDI